MNYWVAWRSSSLSNHWMKFSENGSLQPVLRRTPINDYDMRLSFSRIDDAVVAIIDVMLASTPSQWCEFGVVDDNGTVVWSEGTSFLHTRQSWKDSGETPRQIQQEIQRGLINEPQEAENMSDATITAPLNVKRTALIARLKERQAEEVAKREEAAARGQARRQGLLDAVEKLTADQVANILNQYVLSGNPESLTEQVEKWIKDGKYVSKDAAPTSTETTLDRLVSVLELASDDTVEVKPSDPIYPLL